MTAKDLTLVQKDLHRRMLDRAISLGYNPDEIEPIYDGVGDIEAYISNSPRIMWIMKEPYDELENGTPKGGGWEVYDFTLAYPMWQILMRIIYGIRNKKHHEEIPEANEEMRQMLKGTAYLNLNKMPSGSITNMSQLTDNFPKWKDIVMEQIKIYNPDAIIFGKTFELFNAGDFDEVQSGDNNDWLMDASYPGITAVYKTRNNRILIDAFHPSPMRKCGRPDVTDDVYIDTIIDGVIKAL